MSSVSRSPALAEPSGPVRLTVPTAAPAVRASPSEMSDSTGAVAPFHSSSEASASVRIDAVAPHSVYTVPARVPAGSTRGTDASAPTSARRRAVSASRASSLG